jgi:hypothetical protein
MLISKQRRYDFQVLVTGLRQFTARSSKWPGYLSKLSIEFFDSALSRII